MTLDDEIARKLAEATRSGELASAPSWGRPVEHDAGWEQTPEALRLPFKILKDAGVVPHEVEMLHERARLRQEVDACGDAQTQRELRRKLSELEQSISLRLDALRRSAAP
jgi:hypothetical protein